jgi:hypothetical protein
MRRVAWLLALAALESSRVWAADAPDPLAQARLLYNQGQYESAVTAADRARMTPAQADSADLVAARAYLERFRETSAADDLASARERLRRLNPQRFPPRERLEFIVGLGEALFFDRSYGAAADVFESALETGALQASDSRERVLDWWATAVDREAWPRPEIERQMAYQRIRNQMRDELAVYAGSATAAYWLAAAARAQGDLQAAWDAAQAAWVRAPLTSDRGVRLRVDLDQLVLRAIVPERARVLAQPADNLQVEWEEFKERWKND